MNNSRQAPSLKITASNPYAGLFSTTPIIPELPLVRTNAQAVCCVCGRLVKSEPILPYWQFTPNKAFDTYNCCSNRLVVEKNVIVCHTGEETTLKQPKPFFLAKLYGCIGAGLSLLRTKKWL